MSDHPKIHFDLPTGVQTTDLSQAFTSQPYPVIAIDAMAVRSVLVGFTRNKGTVDAMAPTTTLTGLSLRDVLVTTSVEPEAMEPTNTLTGLTLTTFVFHETTVEPEAMEPTTTLTGLTLTPAGRVAHTVAPEAFTSTTTLTGLTLS